MCTSLQKTETYLQFQQQLICMITGLENSGFTILEREGHLFKSKFWVYGKTKRRDLWNRKRASSKNSVARPPSVQVLISNSAIRHETFLMEKQEASSERGDIVSNIKTKFREGKGLVAKAGEIVTSSPDERRDSWEILWYAKPECSWIHRGRLKLPVLTLLSAVCVEFNRPIKYATATWLTNISGRMFARNSRDPMQESFNASTKKWVEFHHEIFIAMDSRILEHFDYTKRYLQELRTWIARWI